MAERERMVAEARRFRSDEGLSSSQIAERLGVSRSTVRDWIADLPVPQWTRRPNSKDDLRVLAVALRGEGWSVNDIADRLGVARSTAYLWVGHIQFDPNSDRACQRRQEGRRSREAHWLGYRQRRAQVRAEAQRQAAQWIVELSDDEVIRLGAVMYWCEGTKTKPWRPGNERLVFTNSDPGLARMYLRFLQALQVPLERVRFRVAIHESADADRAVRWWAGIVNVPPETFRPTTMKRHSTSTNRHNTGADYNGCLVIDVARSRELYWMIEEIVRGIVEGGDAWVAPGTASAAEEMVG